MGKEQQPPSPNPQTHRGEPPEADRGSEREAALVGFARRFVNRRDWYALQRPDGSYIAVHKPLTLGLVRRHLADAYHEFASVEGALLQHGRCAPSPNQTPARRGLVINEVAGSGQARSRLGEGWGGGWCGEMTVATPAKESRYPHP